MRLKREDLLVVFSDAMRYHPFSVCFSHSNILTLFAPVCISYYFMAK